LPPDPMSMRPDTRKALIYIIVESTRLRDIARATGSGMLTDLLAAAIDEAQAQLNEDEAPPPSGRVVKLVPRKRK
jgi:hypothetical protein